MEKSIKFILTTFVVCAVGVLFFMPRATHAQGHYAYLTTGYNYTVPIIDVSTQAYVTTINAGYYTGAPTLNQRGTKLWIQSSGQFLVINTMTRSVAYASPYNYYNSSQAAISLDGSRVYMLRGSSPSSIIVYDTASYARVDSFAVTGSGYWTSPPVLSLDGNKMYFTDNDDLLYEVDAYNGQTSRELMLNYYSTRLRMSPDGTTLYALAPSYDYVLVIDISSFTIKGSLTITGNATDMALSRDGKKLFVVDGSSTTLRVFSLPSGEYTDQTLLDPGQGLALAPSDSLLYVVHNTYYNDISVFNINTNTTVNMLTAGTYPTAVAMPPPSDNIRPAPISSIHATVVSYSHARLTFTTSGDDSLSGRATFYAVRYDTVPITDAHFSQATKLLHSPRPKLSGQTDTVDITGLRGSTKYYFGIKVGDEVLNLSSLVTDSVTLPAPPHIALQPDSLSRTISDNDSVSLSFTVQNTGGGNLDYTVSVGSISKQADGLCSMKLSDQGNGREASSRSTAALGPKALLLYAYDTYNASLYPADVRTKISNAGSFSTVDTMNVYYSTPTLAQLQRYNVVLVWSSYPFYDPVTLGNVLADYVDGGGGVVTALFAMERSTYSDVYRIKGRFDDENYWAIEPGNVTEGSEATLGTVSVPTHPIMHGVSTFDGGYYSIRLMGGTIAPDAELIASWSDGSPLVAVKSVKGNNRVDLGFYPPSSDVNSEFWLSNTNGAKLMANALIYAAGAGGKINVSFSPDSGSVSTGTTQPIQIIVTTQNARQGNYTLSVQVASDDPENLITLLPVNLTIKDMTPPRVSIRFFQNEAFPEYLNIISVSHETLFTPILKVGLGKDTSQVPLQLLDSANFVYNSNFKLTQGGTLTAILMASDSVGNRASVSRQLSVQHVPANSPAIIASVDLCALLELKQNSANKDLFVTADVDEEATTAGVGEAIGPAYRFSPISVSLNTAGVVSMTYPKLDGAKNSTHLGIYEQTSKGWIYLPTQVDVEHRVLFAQVEQLGEFRIIYDPSIQSESKQEMPHSFELSQNFPNPFNGGTIIKYGLPETQFIELKIFDNLGREVRTLVHQIQAGGFHQAFWDGTTTTGHVAASGIYYYRLHAGSTVLQNKMLLLK